MATETVRLRIRSVANAVLVSGQAYQEPKDALNEFVSNAADEYAEAGLRGARITIILRRRGRRPVISISDDGRGMTVDRLRDVAGGLFSSAKAGDDRTLGEKAIGILAFQQLGGLCDIVSRAEGGRSARLTLERGAAVARLEPNERRRSRPEPGTTVYLHDLDPDVLRTLTQRKVVDYLRRRRGPAIARGDYEIAVVEGRSMEMVTPEQPEGLRVPLPPRRTLAGPIEFALYVSPPDGQRRTVAVVGRAGTTVLDDLTELEELDRSPWNGGQVSGHVAFEGLQQSAGRRAVIRDRAAFPIFLDAIGSVEPAVLRLVERVSRELDAVESERISQAIRRIFDRVLRELHDVENPMRTLLPTAGDGAGADGGGDGARDPAGHAGDPPPATAAPERADRPPPEPPERPGGGPPRPRALPEIAPDPAPGEARSRFDAEAGRVLYSEGHADYLAVKDDEAALLDYLATLVAKEYVVYNNPRAPSEDVAEELVRVLVRVRRHLPRRRPASGRSGSPRP
ncbi:MAG TPA: ATP-binding protein [Miltoncostaeaceae bacterium]|jgi:hypothetical protein|nr:ATP-binding protein [Miltoncostaeaceae bacterium]